VVYLSWILCKHFGKYYVSGHSRSILHDKVPITRNYALDHFLMVGESNINHIHMYVGQPTKVP